MVSVDPNPPEGFYLDPTGMGGLGGSLSPPTNPTSSEDPSKKIRKPYTITKSRESWTEPEHDKFLEALQLFDRDWKKIEAFVGSKTVIQIRSHAQKYFLKAEKSGTNEHLPPPRPKRKAAHPYPQKAPKTAPALSQSEPGFIQTPDSTLLLNNSVINGAVSSIDNSVQSVSLSHVAKDDVRSTGQPLANNCSSTESTPRAQPTSDMAGQGNYGPPLRVLPDFAQVYSFIGSVFDPTTNDHLQKLKNMDSIDVETVLLLMRNLSINLTSPDFEDHRRLLSSYEFDLEQDISGTDFVIPQVNLSENVTQCE